MDFVRKKWFVGNSDKPLFSYKVYLTISFISFAKISPYKKRSNQYFQYLCGVNIQTKRYGKGLSEQQLALKQQAKIACWSLSSHQHCFSYLLGKWCFLVPKNNFAEYFCHIPLPQYILPHYHILIEVLLSFPFFF